MVFTPDWGAKAVAKAPGFSAATDVLELGAGDFSRSLALGALHPDKHFVSSDYTFSRKANENLPAVEAAANVTVATVDARTIDVAPESVDFIFSIALMEHIAELDECLTAIERALRPGGVYFYIQAPFWSCAQGHHYRHANDTTYEFIPKYAHLTNDAASLAALLRDGPEPPFNIKRCVEVIYQRPDLSRLSLRQTKEIVERAPLQLESWTETPDRRYDEALAKAAVPDLRYPIDFEEMSVGGASVVLRKGEPQRRPWQRLLRR